jgi:electron transfer flavoprotein alpha subunit
MNKLAKVCIIASKKSSLLELAGAAQALGQQTVLLLIGEPSLACSAHKAYCLPEQPSFFNYIPTLIHLARQEQPDLVLVENNRNGRLLAALLAARLPAAPITDPSCLWVEQGQIYSQRLVYGGSAERIESAAAPACACLGPGLFAPAEEQPAEEIISSALLPSPGIEFVSLTPLPSQSTNLPAAKRVLGVGRGLGSADNLAAAQDLAAALQAELACTRPVAEEEKWLPRQCYLGVSGTMIKPSLYVAAGISGQIQHMVGVSQAGTIVAINKDANAPIFNFCDYGLVGDLLKVFPALTEKFNQQ